MAQHYQANATYSLRSILDADIDPTLCKLMLHEIKSPLLEHSFQITTDDQRNLQTLNNFHSSPRGDHDQNMRQPHYQSQTNTNTNYSKLRDENRRGDYNTANFENNKHFTLDEYSVTKSVYETSRVKFQDTNQKVKSQIKYNEAPAVEEKQSVSSLSEPHFLLEEKCAESIVSPLQHYEDFNNEYKSRPMDKKADTDFHIVWKGLFSNEPEEGEAGPGIGALLREIFATEVQPEEGEVELPSQFTRKKIFKKQRDRGKVTFSVAIDKLNKIEETEISNFLTFLSRILPLLNKMIPFRNNLRNNQAILHKTLLAHQPVHYTTRETLQNENRICNRIGTTSGKMSEVFETLIKGPVLWEKLYRYQEADSHQTSTVGYGREERVEEDIQMMMKILNEVEEVVEDYVSREKSVEELQIVYGLLYPNQGYQKLSIDPSAPVLEQKSRLNSPISNLKFTEQAQLLQKIEEHNSQSQSPPRSKSPPLLSKLFKLLSSLHIDEAFYQHLAQLCYIWPQICEEGYYDGHPTHFVKQICKNDVVVMGSDRKQGRSLKGYGEKLQKMGFIRNK